MDPCPVLIGREEEMAALRALLDAGGGVAIVSGEAGIGKSRLVREFAAEAAERGRVVLWGRPEEVAQPGPFALIVDLLESIAERGKGDVAREAHKLIGELRRPATEAEDFPAPTPRAVAAEIRGLAAGVGKPPLFILEDLHWGDEASHSVVLNLARAALDDKHGIVMTLRSEQELSHASLHKLLDALRRDRISREVALKPLTDSLMKEMVVAMWAREPSPEQLSLIASRAEGVPFFVEELAQAPDDIGGLVPLSVGQALRTRLDELSPSARHAVTLGSLMLGAIDPTVLAAATDRSLEETRVDLLEAASAGLIADRDGRVLFRHALVREAIAGGLMSVQASRLHALLADALEQSFPNDIERYATSLMHHYTQSGNAAAASRFALVAGDQALAVASLGEARAAFGHALEQSGGETIEAVAGIAEVEFRVGNEEAAATLFRKAADSFLTQGRVHDAARQLKRLAWASSGRVDPAEVASMLDEALEWLSSDSDSSIYAETLVQKGSMLAFLFNRFDEARPLLTAGAEIAQRHQSQSLLAESLDGLAHVAENTGAWAEALDLANRASEMARLSDNAEMIGRTHNNLAIKLACYGQPQEALDVLATGQSHLHRGHGHAAVGALDITKAWIARLMGRPGDVSTLIAKAHGIWQRWRVHRWVLEAWASVERNEMTHAREVVETAWGEVGGEELRRRWVTAAPSLNPERSQLLQAELVVLLAEGRGDEALAVARALVAMDREVGEKFDLGYSLSLHARAAYLAGSQKEAIQVVGELESFLIDAPYPYLLATAMELRGLLSTALDFENAARLFQEAARGFGDLANSLDQARCLLLAAKSMGSEGDSKTTAIALLRRARELADSSESRDQQNRIEALMRALGVRPRAGRPRGKTVEGALSPREAEVVVLVAVGASNADIGHRLYLSDRTVQDHITHALRKLGLSSRAALASWAAKQGMI